MEYTIKEISKITNLPASTLRYYESEGLLPNVTRKPSGYRVFTQKDIDTIKIIECFKMAGLQIKDIKHFMELYSQGDDTLQERLDIFKNQEKLVKEKISNLEKSLELIQYKLWYYQTALDYGTEEVLKQKIITK